VLVRIRFIASCNENGHATRNSGIDSLTHGVGPIIIDVIATITHGVDFASHCKGAVDRLDDVREGRACCGVIADFVEIKRSPRG
jgi:hypothetical protein